MAQFSLLTSPGPANGRLNLSPRVAASTPGITADFLTRELIIIY